MFAWGKKEKDAEEKAVSQVQKMMKQPKNPKLLDKMRMRSDAVAVLKNHSTMRVFLGTSDCLPALVLEKVRSWQGVKVLRLSGNVAVDSSSEYSIPLEVVVHPNFPSVPPVCFVTGDLYIPKWTQSSTLNATIRGIVQEFSSSSVSKRRLQASASKQSAKQVLGVIFAGDGEMDWEAIEAAQLASALHQSEAGQSPPRVRAPQPQSDEEIDWEVFEAVRAVEEAERRERAAQPSSLGAHGHTHQPAGVSSSSGPKHSPLFDAADDTPPSFSCPISLEVMTDPVMAADGHTYEREEIEDWFRNHSTSPLTNMELEHKTLVPNYELQQQIHRHFAERDPNYRHRFMHF